jgi:integrase
VRIVQAYIKRCPKEVLQKAFYLKPLQNYEKREFWYCSVPLGHNSLQNIVKSMMSEAGVEVFFTNHSLRATAVTRLFQENVDEKLIKGLTGHRSESLEGYKRESNNQLAKVSNIVQGQGVKDSTQIANGLEIPIDSGKITMNISGGNCNISIYNS